MLAKQHSDTNIYETRPYNLCFVIPFSSPLSKVTKYTMLDTNQKAMIQQLTGTDEAAGRCCLIGLQVLIKQLTGADQLADRC